MWRAVEAEIHAFFRVVGLVLAGLIVAAVLVVGLVVHKHGPTVAACPPGECVFHPHAPHGPTP